MRSFQSHTYLGKKLYWKIIQNPLHIHYLSTQPFMSFHHQDNKRTKKTWIYSLMTKVVPKVSKTFVLPVFNLKLQLLICNWLQIFIFVTFEKQIKNKYENKKTWIYSLTINRVKISRRRDKCNEEYFHITYIIMYGIGAGWFDITDLAASESVSFHMKR